MKQNDAARNARTALARQRLRQAMLRLSKAEKEATFRPPGGGDEDRSSANHSHGKQ